MHELVTQAPFMSMSEVDNVASLCYRALDGSNYDARCEIAKLLGHLLATTQSPMAPQGRVHWGKLTTCLRVHVAVLYEYGSRL